jgi:hypothetical protein
VVLRIVGVRGVYEHLIVGREPPEVWHPGDWIDMVLPPRPYRSAGVDVDRRVGTLSKASRVAVLQSDAGSPVCAGVSGPRLTRSPRSRRLWRWRRSSNTVPEPAGVAIDAGVRAAAKRGGGACWQACRHLTQSGSIALRDQGRRERRRARDVAGRGLAVIYLRSCVHADSLRVEGGGAGAAWDQGPRFGGKSTARADAVSGRLAATVAGQCAGEKSLLFSVLIAFTPAVGGQRRCSLCRLHGVLQQNGPSVLRDL